jgi:chromosome segregation ATPase
VSFRRDLEDAVRSAEEELIEAFGRLRERAAVTFEKLAAFETRVDAAASASIAKVQGGVEQLTHSYGETLTSFFSTLTESNHKAFQASLGEVRQSSLNLAKSVEVYSGAMQGNLQSLEGKVTQFAEVITRRLAQTTFPDDYFAERLAKPLEALGHSTMGIARQVDHAAANVDQAANSLRAGLATLQARAGDVEGALDRVVTLASSQKALLAGSQAQVDMLSVLSDTLRATQEGLSALSAQVSAQTGTLGQNAVAAATQTATIGNVTTTLQTLETALRTTIPLLERQQQSLAVATRESGSQNAHMGEIGHSLNDLSLTLRQVATSVEQNSRNLGTLVQQVAETNAVAQSTRARDDGIAQKLAATQQESASLNQGVAQVSAQLAGLTRDLQAFVRETAALTQRLGALKVKVQLVDPPDRRSTTDDSERGGAPGGHPTSTASAALPAIAKPSPL